MGTIWNLPAWANHLWYLSCKSFACLKNLSESWPKLQIWTYFEHFMGVRHIPVNGCHIPINGGHIPIIGCHIPIIGRHIPVKGFWVFLMICISIIFVFFWSFPTIDAFTQLIADYTWLALPFDGWIVQPSTGTSRWSATSFTCASNLMQGWVRMVSTSHWCATVNNLSWKFEMALYLTRLIFLHMPHTSSAKVTLVFSWINGWFHDRCLPVNSASKGNFGLKLPSSMRSRKKDSNSAKLAWDHW